MQMSARENYLTTEVMTATPQKLQLLLIEAAMRSVEFARQHIDDADYGPACEAIIRAEQIISEMLATLNHESGSDLVKKVASVYLFVFRMLMEANQEHNVAKLDDAMKVLEVERETWKQVCDKVTAEQASGVAPGGQEASPSIPATPTPASRPQASISPLPSNSTLDLAEMAAMLPVEDPPSSGFSLEA